MNKCRPPKIPLLLANNIFILNCREKAKVFNEFFSHQCRLITNNSVLPTFNFLTDKRIDQISFRRDEIVSLVRNLNPNKASGSDEISGQMLLLCDDSVGTPLKIIFENILLTSLYPDMWKLANVTPIFKKGDLLKTIGQYLYSQFVVKYSKKLFLIIFILILMPTILSPKTSRVFALVILPLISYYFFLMKSIRLSRTLNRLKFAQFFLIFLKPLIKCGTMD